MLNNNQFHSGQSKYSDEICAHAYALFQNGKYADCTLTVKTPTKSHRFNLHKIMLSRVMTVEGDDITITTLDPKITREGLHIALGHIYSAYSYNILVNNKNLLAETLAAATLLSLDDLQSIALDLISSDISSGTLLDYLHSPHPQIEGAIYCYLTKSVVEQGWPMKDSEEYGMLVAFFSQLPFEWLKRVVESRDFAVPSEIERYHFAKQVVGYRSKNSKSMLEENVLLAFGGASGPRSTGVTLVRKKENVNGASDRRVWKMNQV